MSDSIVNSHFPSIPCMDATHTLGVVLVQGQRGEYSAYEGIVRREHVVAEANRPRICEWIAQSGRKLRYHECTVHFPFIKPDQYRA